jgi:hypothetical protein
MLRLNMRKIKGTPYKLVLTGWNLVGIFDKNRFFDRSGMTAKHKRIADEFHANTLQERLTNPRGG